MAGVGVPGGRGGSHNRGAARAKQAAYRQTDKGRMARKLYRMNPEVAQRMAIHRKVKRALKAGL